MSLDENTKKQLYNLAMVNSIYAHTDRSYMDNLISYYEWCKNLFPISNTSFDTQIGVIKL